MLKKFPIGRIRHRYKACRCFMISRYDLHAHFSGMCQQPVGQILGYVATWHFSSTSNTILYILTLKTFVTLIKQSVSHPHRA